MVGEYEVTKVTKKRVSGVEASCVDGMVFGVVRCYLFRSRRDFEIISTSPQTGIIT